MLSYPIGPILNQPEFDSDSNVLYIRFQEPLPAAFDEGFTVNEDCGGHEFMPATPYLASNVLSPNQAYYTTINDSPGSVSVIIQTVKDCVESFGIQAGGAQLGAEHCKIAFADVRICSPVPVVTPPAIADVGAPHGIYRGKNINLGILEKAWDLGKVMEVAFGSSNPLNVADLVDKKMEWLSSCEELKLDEWTNHAVYGFKVAGPNFFDASGSTSICPDVNDPKLITPIDNVHGKCIENIPKSIIGVLGGLPLIGGGTLPRTLFPGDVLLLEVEYVRDGKKLPIEMHPGTIELNGQQLTVFDTIREVVRQSVIVIEPMGNGGRKIGLPPTASDAHQLSLEDWFGRDHADSGAIVVAASGNENSVEGCPGRDKQSNCGLRADLHAMGGGLEDPSYGYTSGAAAIIAGVAVAAQSAAIGILGRWLNGLEMRHYLKQSSPYHQGLGHKPNLQHFIDVVLPTLPQ